MIQANQKFLLPDKIKKRGKKENTTISPLNSRSPKFSLFNACTLTHFPLSICHSTAGWCVSEAKQIC